MKLNSLTSKTMKVLLDNERNQNINLFNGKFPNHNILLQTPYIILGSDSNQKEKLVGTKCYLRNIDNSFLMSKYCDKLMTGYLDSLTKSESSRLSGLPLHGYLDGLELRSRQLGEEVDVSKRVAERKSRASTFAQNFPLSKIVLQFPYLIVGDNDDPFDLFVARTFYDVRQIVPNEINFYCSGFMSGVVNRKVQNICNVPNIENLRTMEYFLNHGYLDGKEFADKWKPPCKL